MLLKADGTIIIEFDDRQRTGFLFAVPTQRGAVVLLIPAAAMGGLGSDIAIEAADVVLMNDDPSSIADAVKISRKTMTIVRENIIFALGVKALVLIFGALGLAGMWLAVFADVGVAVIAILNALRSSRIK